MLRILKILWVPAFLLCMSSVSKINAQAYRLVWSDEFDYTGSPETSKWDYDIGGHGWGNNELQYYTDRTENAKVEGGSLIITAALESYGENDYTSARLVTRNRGDWLYGRIEVKAKLPEGRGTWPAIWMMPTDREYGGWPNSGELDIMEHVGYNMGYVHQTVHTEAYNHTLGTQRGGDIYVADVHQAYHTYAMNWYEDAIRFYVDNQLVFTFPKESGSDKWPFDQRFHLILNIAVGGDWGGVEGVDNTIFPQTMEIDYVRVYEIFVKKPVTGPEKVDCFEEGLVFSIDEFEGAVYTWSFPEGVSIVEGQGTSSVLVNWGETAGTVSVLQTYDEAGYTSTLEVEVLPELGDGPLEIKSNENETGSWYTLEEAGNQIGMHYDK